MPLRLELDDHGQSMLRYVVASAKDAARAKGKPTEHITPARVLSDLLSQEFQTLRRSFPTPSIESQQETDALLEALFAPDNAPRDLAPPGTAPPPAPGRGWAGKPRNERQG